MKLQKYVFVLLIFLYATSLLKGQVLNLTYEQKLAGVFKGKPLFIQNPYNPQTKQYCISSIEINGNAYQTNLKKSAVIIGFNNFSLYSPVNIKIVHKDSTCTPIIINPDAVLFHSFFRFNEIYISDSLLYWDTKGERGEGGFLVEKLDNGIWIEQELVKAKGEYNGAKYQHFPKLEEGANKFRIKYEFPEGSRTSHLYSMEVEYDHYPEPVTFTPKSTKMKLKFSRSASFKIYDANTKQVMEGHGVEADVRRLRRGQYVIYFDDRDPGTFYKE